MQVSRWRQDDPDFDTAVDAVRSQAIGNLEGSMYQRAFKNDITGMFMLKALVPDVYQEKNQVVNVNVGVQVGDWQSAASAFWSKGEPPKQVGG